MRSIVEQLQPIGRALMLPIAVLPVAGLLLRLGQPDLLDMAFVAAAGDAIFANLGLLFAIGVAVGLAKDNNGAAGLAGAVCFLIATKGAAILITAPAGVLEGVPDGFQLLTLASFKTKAIAKLSVPVGILSGLIGGKFYNRFHALKLPDYLAFFAGRRFVPIIAGLAGLVLAFVFGGSWEWLDRAIDGASRTILGLGPVGMMIYGVLNRLLIITGLHHIINNLAWFIIGSYHGVTGDLNRFFAGDPSAGLFMAGFFPVMMFGLPAACLAMYHTAKAERKAAVGGMLLSMALTAILTGVTEPVEFSFMFLAPVLYAIHAVLTGLAFVIMDLLGVRLGFSFSAGLFDYLINFKLATRPLLLLPVGLVYFGLYYGLFRLFIQMFDLQTPGRERVVISPLAESADSRAEGFVLALGGAANLLTIDACTTRLRLIVADQAPIDEAALRLLGAKGIVRPSDKALQVVLGPIADQVASEIRAVCALPARAAMVAPVATGEPAKLLAALGGAANLATVAARSSRLLVTVHDDSKVDQDDLGHAAPRGAVRSAAKNWQIITGGDAERLARALQPQAG
jgi:PTS system N-acetylglucosamine-specific IIC component